MDISLVSLPWEDVIYLKILPRISIKDCYALRSLGGDYVPLIDNYFAGIRKLSSNELGKINNSEAKDFAMKTRSLQELDLSHCMQLSNEMMVELLRNNADTLTHVNVERTSIDDKSLHGIIRCRKLRCLILKNNIWVSRALVRTIEEHLRRQKLMYIDVDGCQQIDSTVYMCIR